MNDESRYIPPGVSIEEGLHRAFIKDFTNLRQRLDSFSQELKGLGINMAFKAQWNGRIIKQENDRLTNIFSIISQGYARSLEYNLRLTWKDLFSSEFSPEWNGDNLADGVVDRIAKTYLTDEQRELHANYRVLTQIEEGLRKHGYPNDAFSTMKTPRGFVINFEEQPLLHLQWQDVGKPVATLNVFDCRARKQIDSLYPIQTIVEHMQAVLPQAVILKVPKDEDYKVSHPYPTQQVA